MTEKKDIFMISEEYYYLDSKNRCVFILSSRLEQFLGGGMLELPCASLQEMVVKFSRILQAGGEAELS